ncbi:phosphatase PAP2 family protein [Nocardioides sp. CPCC 206347]|uniref:phosphatase PAP2 family protein n=1 Tax=Nocardioides sp. CPCC 206347 TaxID=3406463 RepID=UPI003B434614
MATTTLLPQVPAIRPMATPRRGALSTALLLATAFVALAAVVRSGLTASTEGRLQSLPVWSAEHGLMPLLRALEVAFHPDNVAFVGLVIAGAYLLRGQVRVAGFVVATLWLTRYATSHLKSLVGRERPSWQYGGHEHVGAAFPSGHASAAAALVGVIVVLGLVSATNEGQRRRWTHLAWTRGAIVLVVVGADRILLGRHYPTDVLAGCLLAACITLVVAVLAGLVPARRVEPGTGDAGQSSGAPPLRDHRPTPAGGDRRSPVRQ